MTTTLIRNIGTLFTIDEAFPNELGRVDGKAIVIRDGVIDTLVDEASLAQSGDEFGDPYDNVVVVDAEKHVVMPGLVDCHTHLVFGGYRYTEFIMRCCGKSYQEIRAQGGGILSSVRATRVESQDGLQRKAIRYLNEMLALGVTTCEIKSGYGLNTESELKQLEVIRRLNESHCMDIVPTFLGAHEFPAEYVDNRAGYIDLVVNEMIPAVACQKLAVFCDVFCESGVFTSDESRQILNAAKEHGLKVRLHADEFEHSGGGELAAEVGALSADHLQCVSDDAVRTMAENGVIAVLLPGVSFFLNKPYANARRLINGGVKVALATDFNPGSSMVSHLPFMTTLGCIYMGMTVEESIRAITIEAARVLGISEQIGSISPGKQADLICLDIPDIAYMPYHVASNNVVRVIKKGTVVYERNGDPLRN